MKDLVVSFDDEEIEMLKEQLENVKEIGMTVDTLEDYVYYATMAHCKVMKTTAAMMQQVDGALGELLSDGSNVQIGVLNMPIQLENGQDKEELSQYLNDVLTNAIKDFNNRHNGQLN